MANQESRDLEAFAKEGGIEADEFAPALPGEVTWDKREYLNFVAEHAIIPQTEELSKIVFHVKQIAPKVADMLSLYLRDEITKKMKPPALVEAGISPLLRNQWDLVLFHLPKFRAPMVRDAILLAMDKFSM
jgi:hypothetical protein